MNQVVAFLKEAQAEFKRVTWPGREKTVQLTVAVLTVTVAVAVILAALDYFFNLMVRFSMQ